MCKYGLYLISNKSLDLFQSQEESSRDSPSSRFNEKEHNRADSCPGDVLSRVLTSPGLRSQSN